MSNQNEGALWTKKSKNGLDYLSGYVRLNNKQVYISVFEDFSWQPGTRRPKYTITINKPVLPTSAPAQPMPVATQPATV